VLGGAETLEAVQGALDRYRDGDRSLIERIPATAKQLLGLTQQEADILFHGDPSGYNEETDEYGSGWPQPFADEWYCALGDEQPAIAIAYLDYIIETGKVLE